MNSEHLCENLLTLSLTAVLLVHKQHTRSHTRTISSCKLPAASCKTSH